MATATLGRADEDQQARVEMHAARVHEEYHSKREAKPMGKADVCNVEKLTAEDYSDLLRRLELSNPKLYADLMEATDELWGWDDGDERWGLTPHELRKLNRRRAL